MVVDDSLVIVPTCSQRRKSLPHYFDGKKLAQALIATTLGNQPGMILPKVGSLERFPAQSIWEN
jgi:hypothetical protein